MVKRGLARIATTACVLALAGCGSGGSSKLTATATSSILSTTSTSSTGSAATVSTATSTTRPGSTTTTTAAPRHGPSTNPPAVVAVGDADNGRTVALHRGDTVRVVLASTYWTIQAASDASVLSLAGPPVVAPQPSGCVPGQGCGTVTATFGAKATGQANVVAMRTTCGEAMLCNASNGRWTLTVVVT